MKDEKNDSHEDVFEVRRSKLAEWRERTQAYPNDFTPSTSAAELQAQYYDHDKAALEGIEESYRVAGRVMLKRNMGKASFMQIHHDNAQIQVYLRKNDLPEGLYEQSQTWDLGDIIGVEGTIFRTNTGELSIHATAARLLTKSLRPLPDKHHGLSDQEQRYRERYVDLIANEKTREAFVIRSKLVDSLRQFLQEHDYLEVETPMMHSIPGGALAKPFITHHNALDMQLFLRIAPELFLKRLIVGGFPRVFEINRNFRNEGLSTRHNPEFTMVEFYQAYANYEDLMDLTESMMRYLSSEVLGTHKLTYQGLELDFSQPFARMTVKEAIVHHEPSITLAELDDIEQAKKLASKYGIKLEPTYGLGKIQIELFEALAEDKLMQPTFITAYPAEVSPLARKNDADPFITDRFEFFVGGREIANGFSELNDPEDQAARFKEQVMQKDSGDEEAMHFDADYINALEYGMPPTAGEGIGIDRLAMLFTDSLSIRDVILFPLMRPVSKN